MEFNLIDHKLEIKTKKCWSSIVIQAQALLNVVLNVQVSDTT